MSNNNVFTGSVTIRDLNTSLNIIGIDGATIPHTYSFTPISQPNNVDLAITYDGVSQATIRTGIAPAIEFQGYQVNNIMLFGIPSAADPGTDAWTYTSNTDGGGGFSIYILNTTADTSYFIEFQTVGREVGANPTGTAVIHQVWYVQDLAGTVTSSLVSVSAVTSGSLSGATIISIPLASQIQFNASIGAHWVTRINVTRSERI